ncbi:MAG: hypothetical protein D6820_12760, partial [Lentisphaerae bacterium]
MSEAKKRSARTRQNQQAPKRRSRKRVDKNKEKVVSEPPVQASTGDSYEEMEQAIRRLLGRNDYVPCNEETLAEQLGLTRGDRELFERVLHDLLESGMVVRLKRKGLVLGETADLLSGSISFLRNGAAMVNCPGRRDPIFIPPGLQGTALPGDLVQIRLNKQDEQEHRLLEGKVTKVLDRRCRHIVGVLSMEGGIAHVVPMQSTFPRHVLVRDTCGAEEGDRVLVKLGEWNDPALLPPGEISEVLGPAENPQLDTLAVMKAYDIEEEFS